MGSKLPDNIEDIFYPSEELRQIVEAHKFTFYLVDNADGNELNDMERRGSARGYFRFGQEYFVYPIPNEGESLEDAFERIMIREASGPALDINGQVVPFTRIEFGYDNARVMSPPPGHPGAEIAYENNNLINTFKTGFFIQTPGRTKKMDPRLN